MEMISTDIFFSHLARARSLGNHRDKSASSIAVLEKAYFDFERKYAP